MMATGRPLYLFGVRHGESEGNLAHSLEREGDPSAIKLLQTKRHETNYRLTDFGRWQLNVTGKWIRTEYSPGFERYYCSDTVRGRESAQHLKLPKAEWHPVSLLRERDHQEFAALTEEQKRELKEKLDGALLDSPYYYHPFGEAPATLIDQRVSPMLERVSGHDYTAVIWVCHGDWLRALNARILHFSKDDWKDMYDDESETRFILNGVVHIYTRVDPHNPFRILPYLGWFKSYCPWNPEHPSNTDGWVEIERKSFSNQDLGESVKPFEQMVNRSVPERFIPEQ